MVISGEDVCRSVVFGTPISVFVLWSELLMTIMYNEVLFLYYLLHNNIIHIYPLKYLLHYSHFMDIIISHISLLITQ